MGKTAMNEEQISSVIAGALFDFAGFLTTLDSPVRLGASCDAAPAVKLLSEWAAKRGLNLDEANVTGWGAALERSHDGGQ